MPMAAPECREIHTAVSHPGPQPHRAARAQGRRPRRTRDPRKPDCEIIKNIQMTIYK